MSKKIGLICGGPSKERGISLNSARSVMDHLQDIVEIVPFYVNLEGAFYQLEKGQLYSNTPSDFDFKLVEKGRPFSESEIVKKLSSLDLIFPVIHGNFGETGEFQAFLEYYAIPFLGSSAYACQNMYYKDRASAILKKAGFSTLPSCVLTHEDVCNNHKIDDFFDAHVNKNAVLKPVAGGSSLGVFSVKTAKEVKELLQDKSDPMLLEPFCYGKEFTVIVLQSQLTRDPVALVPTEIKIEHCYDDTIFDYRRKYLPTSNTTWACPPDFLDDTIQQIRCDAERIFKLFRMRDFARLDGWVLEDGTILFTDLNPISGMEQNSFIFQQTSRLGLTHRDFLSYLIESRL